MFHYHLPLNAYRTRTFANEDTSAFFGWVWVLLCAAPVCHAPVALCVEPQGEQVVLLLGRCVNRTDRPSSISNKNCMRAWNLHTQIPIIFCIPKYLRIRMPFSSAEVLVAGLVPPLLDGGGAAAGLLDGPTTRSIYHTYLLCHTNVPETLSVPHILHRVCQRFDSSVLAAVHLHPQLALLAERKLNDAGRLGCILRVSLDKETS